MTDSGGVQKEAYWLKIPCFTLRDETEWVETVRSGWNVLVGAETEKIIEGVNRFTGKNLPRRSSLFGDGKASEKIVETLMKYFS
jgi:UDP-N-acetylglucosamine 2-epimerase